MNRLIFHADRLLRLGLGISFVAAVIFGHESYWMLLPAAVFLTQGILNKGCQSGSCGGMNQPETKN